jgi:translation initiation factor 1
VSGPRRPVWSTERSDNLKGAACRRCGDDPCRCEPLVSQPAAAQKVRVRKERGGRGGKTVTVAGPLVLTRTDAGALLSALKKLCGGGGTLKVVRTEKGDPAFEIEVQGDHAERVVAELSKQGYPAKRSGG